MLTAYTLDALFEQKQITINSRMLCYRGELFEKRKAMERILLDHQGKFFTDSLESRSSRQLSTKATYFLLNIKNAL